MQQPRITLDQWLALVSVVELGSYAKAAAHLHKSQSTLTYAIQKLEELLGVRAFALQGRRAVLTDTGELLYRRGKVLVEEAARLEQAAGELARGWEPEIRLAVEILFPTWLLLRCLGEFARERPDTRVELYETVLSGNDEALAARRVDLAIGARIPEGFAGDALMPERFVCAAAPGHPLHALGRLLTLEDLRAHRHLLLRDSGIQRAPTGGWQNERRWTLTNKATWIRAAVMGFGYAWYPEQAVREELERGALVPLPLREGAERFATLYLMLADPEAAGPGIRLLAGLIKREVAKACREDPPPPAGAAPPPPPPPP